MVGGGRELGIEKDKGKKREGEGERKEEDVKIVIRNKVVLIFGWNRFFYFLVEDLN